MRLSGDLRIGAIALLLVAAMAGPTRPGNASERPRQVAEPPAEGVAIYDAVLTIRADGVLHVHEAITYDFGDSGGTGIVRAVPYRIKNRLYGIQGVRASSSTGAPATVRTTKFLHELRISIGAGKRPVGGSQAYVLDYDVTGAVTPHPDRDELVWDVLGTGWEVPIDEAAVRVTAPVPPVRADCAAGRPGVTGRCGVAGKQRSVTEFTQSGLQPHEGMMIRVTLPEGTIRAPSPRYAPPHFRGSGVGYAALALALLLAGVVRCGGRALAGRVPVLAGGTFLLATGVIAMGWDMADDILRGGVWEVSVGDAIMIGLAAGSLGAILLWTARRRPAPESE